jgi:hypothetical protein
VPGTGAGQFVEALALLGGQRHNILGGAGSGHGLPPESDILGLTVE